MKNASPTERRKNGSALRIAFDDGRRSNPTQRSPPNQSHSTPSPNNPGRSISLDRRWSGGAKPVGNSALPIHVANPRNSPTAIKAPQTASAYIIRLEAKVAALDRKVDELAASTSLGQSDLLVGQTALGRQLLAITDLLTRRSLSSVQTAANNLAEKSHSTATHDDGKAGEMAKDPATGTPPKAVNPVVRKVASKDVDFGLDDQDEEFGDSDDDDERDDFRAINKFKLVDKDGSGALDLAEIISGAKMLGLSSGEARAMYNSLEKNGDGEVDMHEFLEKYKEQRTTIASPDDDDKPTSSQKIRQPEVNALSIDPRGTFRVTWDLAVMMPLLLYLTVMIPFRMGFNHEAELYGFVYWVEFMLDLLFIVDMGLNFCTGIVVVLKDGNGEHFEAVEYDKSRVALQYCKSWFFIDLFSGVPFALISLLMGTDGDALSNAKSLKALRFLKLARLLKLGRLLKIEKILSTVDRDTIDMIEDFFHDALSINTILSLVLAMAFLCHILACGFVSVGKASSESDKASWLEYELEGPFASIDTTGQNGNGAVYSIYIAAFYFCLTTMVSVGYGDVVPRNNSERLYVIFVEFVSSITFATIIVLITAVVTTLDVGSKMKAEALAEVGSFVDFRQFPRKLARRIRRHFRNFYSLKTASDEKKIFEQLSTSLRKEVSQFLVLEIMGSESFFMTISTGLWPRLLPLLQPMTFEANERVCKQGEECDEMHVVISGILTGSSHLEGQPVEPIVQRTMTKGDSINVLCMLEIWHKCVETVVSGINTVETYSAKAEEFQKLFQATDLDAKNFKDLQMREVKKFQFAPDPEAPTRLGKPLYISSFSSVQLQLLKLSGPVVGVSDEWTKVWVVADLVDSETGNPFNEFWDHATEPMKPHAAADGHMDLECSGPGGEQPEVDSTKVRWSDVSVALKHVSLRVRVFQSTYATGMEACVGRGMLPLQAVHNEIKAARRGSQGSLSLSSPTPLSPSSLLSPLPSTPPPVSGQGRLLARAGSLAPSEGSSEETKWDQGQVRRTSNGSERLDDVGVCCWCEIKPVAHGRGLLSLGGGGLLGVSGDEKPAGGRSETYQFGAAGDHWGGQSACSAVQLRVLTQTPKSSKMTKNKLARSPSFTSPAHEGGVEDAALPRRTQSTLVRRPSSLASPSLSSAPTTPGGVETPF